MKKLLIAVLGLVMALPGFAQSGGGSSGDTVDVTFTYSPSRRERATVKEVTVAGEFNNWDAFATEMTKNEDGTWSVTVPIKKGKGQWKYLVNGNWVQNMETIADKVSPKPDEYINDPYGGRNAQNDFGK